MSFAFIYLFLLRKIKKIKSIFSVAYFILIMISFDMLTNNYYRALFRLRKGFCLQSGARLTDSLIIVIIIPIIPIKSWNIDSDLSVYAITFKIRMKLIPITLCKLFQVCNQYFPKICLSYVDLNDLWQCDMALFFSSFLFNFERVALKRWKVLY